MIPEKIKSKQNEYRTKANEVVFTMVAEMHMATKKYKQTKVATIILLVAVPIVVGLLMFAVLYNRSILNSGHYVSLGCLGVALAMSELSLGVTLSQSKKIWSERMSEIIVVSSQKTTELNDEYKDIVFGGDVPVQYSNKTETSEKQTE
nr:MAG TPA: hypothetical protein [Caudoviricetes sp.]